MSVQKPDVLLTGNKKPIIVDGLADAVNLYCLISLEPPPAGPK